MKHDTQPENIIRQEIDTELSFLNSRPSLHNNIMSQIKGEKIVNRKISLSLVFAILLALGTVTAVAIELLSGMQIIEQFAVPMAQENDSEAYTQESYTNEELVQLIQTLNENGITLDEDSHIMQALRNGQGYWEEEVLMEICREAFGGNFSTWSIEEKHWFDSMTVQIGFKEKNPYRIPDKDDMSIPEAKAHAAALLKAEYGAELPVENDEYWMLWEWFYESWTDMDGFHPAKWKFEYINSTTNVQEYSVSFDQEGTLLDITEAGFHGEVSEFGSFSMADRYFSDKYGAMPYWPLEAWSEFGEAIASFEPEGVNQWCYINAGYRMPPEGAISGEEAVNIAMEHIALPGEADMMLICCTSKERPIYKVKLAFHFPGSEVVGRYDAVWSLELDCMTGEILDKWEYTYGPDSPAIRMYVPFSVHENAPSFSRPAATTDPALLAEKERQARAYEDYRQQYGDNWFFWPLEAQMDALGGHHSIPQDNEMTREEAIVAALQAIEAKHGKDAMKALGDYQTGVICCRYEEPEGVRLSWEIYFTSDPDTMGNGFRVDFDDPSGLMEFTEVEVQRANIGNG